MLKLKRQSSQSERAEECDVVHYGQNVGTRK